MKTLFIILCSLQAKAWALEVLGPSVERVVFPVHANVVNVTKAPYGAKGDGVTDDTEALQRAINEHTGRHHMLYFPKGTYLVSRTLTWPKKWGGKENWGFTMLQGESAEGSVIRLKDGTFTDKEQPRSLMWCGGFGSADWFHNHIQNLTFHTGSGNPGAIGLQFYSNNYGALRNCYVVSGDGTGAIGLDLGHRDMNGPLLVRRVEVRGFRRGIATANAVNSQTFEHVTLRGQTEFGVDNAGQSLAIRGLRSEGAVVAVRSYGTLSLLDATLTGQGAAAQVPAVINYNGGQVLLRDVRTSGFACAFRDAGSPDWTAAVRAAKEKPRAGAESGGGANAGGGAEVAEYFSNAPTGPFAGKAGSLRLAVEETPDEPRDDPGTWAVADDFGADPSGERDSSEALQRAVDSGAGTLFLPGHYALSKTVIVRGKLRRIVGLGGELNRRREADREFRIEGPGDAVTFEHIANLKTGIENATDRTVILRSIGTRIFSQGTGTIFFEDVAGHELAVKNQKVFARQLNIENEGTHLLNDGGQVWVLGYKTERGGSLVDTRRGGRSEILGTFSYTTTAGKLAPMFVTENASVFAFLQEVCFNGDPFATLVRETQDGVTKTILRGGGHTLPYVSGGQR